MTSVILLFYENLARKYVFVRIDLCKLENYL